MPVVNYKHTVVDFRNDVLNKIEILLVRVNTRDNFKAIIISPEQIIKMSNDKHFTPRKFYNKKKSGAMGVLKYKYKTVEVWCELFGDIDLSKYNVIKPEESR